MLETIAGLSSAEEIKWGLLQREPENYGIGRQHKSNNQVYLMLLQSK